MDLLEEAKRRKVVQALDPPLVNGLRKQEDRPVTRLGDRPDHETFFSSSQHPVTQITFALRLTFKVGEFSGYTANEASAAFADHAVECLVKVQFHPVNFDI